MKAFLLAAGSGARLRPLTDNTPKCLLPIRGVPLLQIWLENCRAAGIDEVLINVHAHAGRIKSFVSVQNTGVRIVVAEELDLLGSAGTLKQNCSFVKDEKSFFVLYADVLTNMDLRAILDFHHARNLPGTLGIYQVPDPNRCGIVGTDASGIVQSFVEKPVQPQSNWAFSGVMILQPHALEFVPADRPADLGFHVLPKLVGSMTAYPIREYLLDIGTPANYAAAQTSWPGLSGRPAK